MESGSDIAIIGMAGRYPKAKSPDELWQNLVANLDLAASEGRVAENYVDQYLAVADIDLFDNDFFGFTPYEASITDPQQRIMLECVYEAIQDAGFEQEPPGLKVGVFATASFSTYLLNNILNSTIYQREDINYPVLIGNDKDFLATKVAYKLNFTGPAISVQCACSSSLAAVHYGCQSLLLGECDIAIVGGVSISVPQEKGYFYKEGGILSRDGVCRPFDAAANGTVKGNGCSVIVLRRLADSLQEHDHIHAVIKSTAINNDGSGKIGYTAPSIMGESAVVTEAIEFANLSATDIDYIETHGTGTKLGDPIEIKALQHCFGNSPRKIPVGSIKANIGHLDVASGITSIIKAVYMLKENVIPPLKNFRQVNAEIQGLNHPFYFPTQLEKRALNNISVSSFGLGGTNVHAVISQKPSRERATQTQLPYYLIPLHYNHAPDWEQYRNTLMDHCSQEMEFSDFVYTMSVGRKRRNNMIQLLVKDRVDFIRQLENRVYEQPGSTISVSEFASEDFQEIRKYFPSFNRLCSETWQAQNTEPESYQAAFGKFLEELSGWDAQRVSANLNRAQQVAREQAGPMQPVEKLLRFLAEMNQSQPLNFAYLYAGFNWQKVALPHYPLNRKRFWIEADNQAPSATSVCPASAGEVETKTEAIVNIWSSVLGVAAIDEAANYFDLGGDSLLAIEIIEAMNRTLGVKLTTNEFMNNPTPLKLQELIRGKSNLDPGSCVAPVRKSPKAAPTLFLVHPAGGTTFCYRSLNHYLVGDYNLYAIDLPDNYDEYPSMEDLAGNYIWCLQKYQPRGPYILGGYSLGGNLAYEMAVQFEKANEQVTKLLMFDSYPPSAYHHYQGEVNYQELFPFIIRSYLNPGTTTSVNSTLYSGKTLAEIIRMLKAEGLLGRQYQDAEIISFYNKWIYSHQLLRKHRQETVVAADVTLFDSQGRDNMAILELLGVSDTPKQVWQNHFKGQLTIRPVKGNHWSMFGDQVNVKYLAREFESVLAEWQL